MTRVLGFLFWAGMTLVLVGVVLDSAGALQVGREFLYGGLVIAAPMFCGLLAHHINPEGKK